MKIHLIGIGGIGISALAQYYLVNGHEVSGSDLTNSKIIEKLKRDGAEIEVGFQQAEHIPEAVDRVIYSLAISKNNSELKRAKQLQEVSSQLEILSYPQALGKLTKENFTIAVSGTHGKSTTTAMLALILIEAGFDPTVFLGTKLNEFGGTNFRKGESQYLLIEADEYKAAFLNYSPQIIVLTNIEKDHLDFYKDINQIIETFKQYVDCLPESGSLIYNQKDKNIEKLRKEGNKKIKEEIGFSLDQEIVQDLKKILKVPGEYNIENALAAVDTADVLKIPREISLRALSKYQGAWRRFEKKRVKMGEQSLTLINDFAHHPTELKAFLGAVKESAFPGQKIWVVFQPHQNQRTLSLQEDFIQVIGTLARLDSPCFYELIITDIYDVPGREKKEVQEKINTQKLIEAINETSVIYLPLNKVKKYLKTKIQDNDILAIVGAGDIYKWGQDNFI
jgi:UDP-N-acetylmuramate--alanine ligase